MPAQKRSVDRVEDEQEEHGQEEDEEEEEEDGDEQGEEEEEDEDEDDEGEEDEEDEDEGDEDEDEDEGDGDDEEEDDEKGGGEDEECEEEGEQKRRKKRRRREEGRNGGDADSDDCRLSAGSKDSEFIVVRLSEIRKEVQCPICLGIIRKTRTVMECLHRFCRECIDKSMRMGNNECPACRTHCASRRSLRDDPNYDALIAALYPDIDKYEEEELAFHEEEKARNRQIQASIAQTFRRQSEALSKRRSTAKPAGADFIRKSQSSFRTRGRNRRSGHACWDEDGEDVNGEGGKESVLAEPSPDVRQKRHKRWTGPRFSLASASGSNADGGNDEVDDTEARRESRSTSPGRAGTPEVLVWGKGGTRSNTRHCSLNSSNGKNARNSRLSRLIEHMRNLDENDNEFEVHVKLLPMDDKLPALEQPFLCCQPTSSVRHLCQFVALQISVQAEEIELYVKESRYISVSHRGLEADKTCTTETAVKLELNVSKEDRKPESLGAQETLAALNACYPSSQGNLVLVYRTKAQKS